MDIDKTTSQLFHRMSGALRMSGGPDVRFPPVFRREDTSGLAKISDCRSAPDVRLTGCPVPIGCPVCFTQHTPVDRMSGSYRFSEGKTPVDLQKYRIADRHQMSDSPDVRCLTDIRYVSPSTLQFTEFTSQAPDVRSRPDVRCMDRMSGLDRMSVTYAGKLPQRL